MGKVVMLGHGGIDQVEYGDLSEVLVPPDTTLQFYSDAGQVLLLPKLAPNYVLMDYKLVREAWPHFKPSQARLSSGEITLNFKLMPEDEAESRELAKSLDWGAEVVVVEKGVLYLCTGTADTCPTPALLVQQQLHAEGKGDPVPEGRWEHACGGLLTKHAGHDLHWLACTEFAVVEEWLPAMDAADVWGPGGDPRTWEQIMTVQGEAALARISKKNTENLQATQEGGTVTYAVGDGLALIGPGHWAKAAERLAQVTRQEGVLRRRADGFHFVFLQQAEKGVKLTSESRGVLKQAIAAAKEVSSDDDEQTDM